MPHNVLFTWSLTQGRIVIPYLPVMWVSHCRTLFGGEVAQIEPPPYPVSFFSLFPLQYLQLIPSVSS